MVPVVLTRVSAMGGIWSDPADKIEHGYRPPDIKMDMTEPAAEPAAERPAPLDVEAEIRRLRNAARDALCRRPAS